MHIDPKAPYGSPQHPHNWRQPVFIAPGGKVVDGPAGDYTMDMTPPASVATPPEQPATPVVKKAAPKKPARKKASDLASALAKLGDQ